ENDTIDKPEGMIEHEGLQFAVVCSAPKCSLDERKPDHHLTLLGAVFVITGASNDPSRLSFDDRKSTLGFHRAIKELLTDVALVALPVRSEEHTSELQSRFD